MYGFDRNGCTETPGILTQANANATAWGIGAHVPDDGVAQLIELVRPVAAAVLYLCSAEADVIDPDRPKAVPRRAMVPGEAPRVWEVGYRLATSLRNARLGADDHGGSDTGPRAHLRRAHCLGHAGALSQ